MKICPTGIEQIDRVLGGFPCGSIILVAGNPGAGKTTFAATYLYMGATKFEEPGIYVSFVEDRQSFIGNMRTLGLDFESLEAKGLFKFMGFPFTETRETIDTFVKKVFNEVIAMRAKRVVIDSITALLQILKSRASVRSLLHSVFMYGLKNFNVTTLLVADLPFGASTIGLGVEEFLVDGVLVLRVRLRDGIVLRWMEIWKLRGRPLIKTFLPFVIGQGGFLPLIPIPQEHVLQQPLSIPVEPLNEFLSPLDPGTTILLVGPSGSGKTIFLLYLMALIALQKHRAIYLSFDEPTQQIHRKFVDIVNRLAKEIGIENCDDVFKRVLIMHQDPSNRDLAFSIHTVYRVIEQLKPSILVLDGFRRLLPVMKEEVFDILLREMLEYSKRTGLITVFSYTSPRGIEDPEGCLERMKTYMDIIISTERHLGEPNRIRIRIHKHRLKRIEKDEGVIIL